MLQEVSLKRKKVDDYVEHIGRDAAERLRRLAEPLRGKRVLHLNATAHGGGVAELLNSSVPLLKSLGIEAEWALLCKDAHFFEVTKNMHNALQGKPFDFEAPARDAYLERNRLCAEMVDREFDLVMVHDPQPAAIRHFCGAHRAKWIWRCHIDTSQPDREVWEFLRPFVEEYDAAVFTLPAFVPPDLQIQAKRMIAPAIDPLTSKNIDLRESVCRTIVAEFGVDLSRPFLLQVSRFDPWKDPLGVLEVHARVREKIDGLQLVYAGSMADDDPEGWEIHDQVKRKAAGDPDIHLYTNLQGVHAFEINCFQRAADVVIQKSKREGFGLVVSEALWKEAAVVAGHVGGIPLQLEDGANGLLAGDTEDFCRKVTYLFKDKEQREAFGRRGRESVREKFLITRLVREEIELYRELLGVPVPLKQ